MKTKLVIFGITGDLSTRKLLPALSNVIMADGFGDLSIIGVSRRHFATEEILGEHHALLAGTTTLLTMDVANPDEYGKLHDCLDVQPGEQVLFYLAVPPESSARIIENLGASGLNGPHVKLLLEKPFGMDLASAQSMITHVGKYYEEAQIYRIDHYLAKETAQNIIIFRAQNALFSQIWDNRFIERIEIVASESLGIEGRAQFYEQTGALRDVAQGHLMQLLALAIMDLPSDGINWDNLPAGRLAALQSVLPADPDKAVRGQYDGYKTEVGNPASTTETFTSFELFSSAEKWQDVPFRLTTGKMLGQKCTEVRVHFKRQHLTQANCLIFAISPNEGVEIDVFVSSPGYDKGSELKKLKFEYPHDAQLPDAYEQVIVDAILSQKSLFASGDEVLRSWEILQPIQESWKTSEPTVYHPNGPL